MNQEKRIEIIYSEYTRLCERLDSLIDGSLNDFKLLSFILPAVIGIGGLLTNNKMPFLDSQAPEVIGFGFFLAVLLVVTVIAFRDMLKLSMINYHIVLIKKYELTISDMLDTNQCFDSIHLWNSKFEKNHNSIYGVFTLIMIICLTVIPVLVLLNVKGGASYAIIYGSICVFVYILHFYALNRFLRKPFKKLTGDRIV